MGRYRFVEPEATRLPLSDGDWIDVKKELNAGDTRKIFTDLVKEMRAGEQPTLDAAQVGKTKILTYVIGWSLKDAAGKAVPFTASALDNLDTGTYQEIADAVDVHDEAIEKARTERKNGTDGANVSSTISPSAA